ncbi:HNH endonuclease [Microbacterium oleivorans]
MTGTGAHYMPRIELRSQDKIKPYVIVDEADVPELSKYTWRWSGRYATTSIPQPDGRTKSLAMHRLIMNAKQGEQVDHINRKTFDNRRANLRIVTSQQNNWNRGKGYSTHGTSAYVGVSLYKPDGQPRWQASIAGNVLGIFDDEDEAAYVRDQAAMQLYGEHAFLNFNYEPVE